MKTVFAILLMILGLFVHKIEGIFTKKYGEKYNKGGFIFTAIVSFFSMLFFLTKDLISDANGLHFERSLIYFGLSAGVCFAVASMTMYWVLGHGPYGLCNLISSYSVLITIGHGLIIGERLSVRSWIGVVLICISLVLIMSHNQKNKQIKVSAKWLAVLVFSVLCAAAFGVMQRQQQIEFSHTYDKRSIVKFPTMSITA